jgi:magnesium transporter
MNSATYDNSTDFLPNIDDVCAAREYLLTLHSADCVAYLSEYEADDIAKILLELPLEKQADIINYIPLDDRLELGEALGASRLARIMELMARDDRVDMLKALPEELAEATLLAMAQSEREDIRRLASYPEGSAGAIMTTDYATLSPALTAAQAINKLRIEAPQREVINRAYIIDESRNLLGSVKLQTLLFARPNVLVTEIMEAHTHTVQIDDAQEYVARQIAKYDVIALPVLDQQGRLVGVVTHDDAMDVLQEETTEDFHKSANVGKVSGNLRYASGWLLYRKRIIWLIVLVFGNLFSGAGISFFEEIIAANVALVFFLPLLIGSGGNAGAQSATLMVRALATGDVVMRDWSKMLLREFAVSFALGITMAAAVSLIGIWRGDLLIAKVVCITMLLVVIMGSIIGLLLPFILHRLKLDPATASGPLITSIADAVGVMIYFSIAKVVLL